MCDRAIEMRKAVRRPAGRKQNLARQAKVNLWHRPDTSRMARTSPDLEEGRRETVHAIVLAGGILVGGGAVALAVMLFVTRRRKGAHPRAGE